MSQYIQHNGLGEINNFVLKVSDSWSLTRKGKTSRLGRTTYLATKRKKNLSQMLIRDGIQACSNFWFLQGKEE